MDQATVNLWYINQLEDIRVKNKLLREIKRKGTNSHYDVVKEELD